uniref:Omp-1-7 n=1 Tax=Ehrlichia ewingii TaxID=947 RepID=B1N6B0_9RICK|nr:Omp-1-7 [Ehrlichia ewingii]
MSNKKKFTIGTVLVSLLAFLPTYSFSAPISNNSEDNIFGLYIAGQYRPGVSHFSGFGVTETNFATQKLMRVKKDSKEGLPNILKSKDNFTEPYVAKFQDNAVSFSGAIGYSYPEGLRLEIEGSYETFDVKDPKDCSVKDAFRHLALVRELDTGLSMPKEKKYTVMRNNGLSIASILINGCYDFDFDNLIVSPYVCLGIGEDFIEFFDVLHIKFAYQGKLGISYELSPRINVFADGYYHKVIGNQFKNLNVNHVVELDDFPKVTSAVATLNVGYFGGEVGVRFIF